MKPLWSRIASFITVTAFVLVPALHAHAATNDAAGSRDLVNNARADASLAALHDDSRLDSIATAQAQRMADRDAIYHNPNLKSDADAAGVNWRWIGENVGVGPDVASVHEGFMASPGHHENIVYADYNVIGTGTAIGKDGSIFVAQVYAGIEAAAAPAAVAKPMAKPVVAVAPKPVATVTPEVEAVQETPQPVAPAAEPRVNVLFGGVVNPGSVPVG